MDEYERTTSRIRTEQDIPTTQTVVPVQPAGVIPSAVPLDPAVPAAAVVPRRVDRIVTEHESVRETPTALEMTRRIVTLAFGILQALLVLRVILLLLVANRENDIVQFILNVTAPFVNPFRDMFALDQVGSQGSVLDIAAIVALIGWTLVELLIIAILNLGARRRTVVA